MPRQRSGVSPILASVMLVLLAVALGTAAYTFLAQSQETVIGETRQAELETVNATCAPDRVTWWVNNTGEVPTSPTASLFVYDSEGVNATLTRTGLSMEERLTRAGGMGKVAVSPAKRLELGGQYTLELSFDDADLSTTCNVGGEWWDANWNYRRALDLDTADDVTAQVTFDASGLVDNGKMRSDCNDVRGVKNREVVPYRVITCNPNGNVRVRMNLSGVSPGEGYVYYGNLQAGSAGQVLVNEGVVIPELGPEEEVNLP